MSSHLIKAHVRPKTETWIYLLLSVQSVVEFPPSVQSQQPHVLPPGDQQVDSWVLGFYGSLCGRCVHRLCGRAFSCKLNTKSFTMTVSNHRNKKDRFTMTSFHVLIWEGWRCHIILQWLSTKPGGSGFVLWEMLVWCILPALPLSRTGIWDWIWGSTVGFLLCVLVILSTSGCFLVISSMNACKGEHQLLLHKQIA